MSQSKTIGLGMKSLACKCCNNPCRKLNKILILSEAMFLHLLNKIIIICESLCEKHIFDKRISKSNTLHVAYYVCNS